jgi:MFS family permease
LISPALLNLIFGAYGDRWDRRRLVTAGKVGFAGAGAATAALILLEAVAPWHLLLGGLAIGVADSIGGPARGALVVDLVGKKSLLAATSMGELANYAGEIVAPVAVGVVIASSGIGSVFVCAGIALATGSVLMMAVPRGGHQPVSERNGESVLDGVRNGLAYAARTPGIGPLLLLASRMLFAATLFPLLPIFARDITESGSTGFAIITASLGAGFVTGSLFGTLKRVRRPGLLILGLIVLWDAGMLMFSQTESLMAGVVLIYVMGAAGSLTDNLITTSIQQKTEDNMRGRVSGVHRLVNYFDPAGAMLGGAVASLTSVEFALIWAACCSAALTVGVAIMSSSVRRL